MFEDIMFEDINYSEVVYSILFVKSNSCVATNMQDKTIIYININIKQKIKKK